MGYDATSGKLMDEDLMKAARELEMETFKKLEMKRPIKDLWERRGKAPIVVKWVDADKGDAQSPEHRSGLVAKEIKHDKGGLVRSSAAVGSEGDTVLAVGEYGERVPGRHRRCEGVLPRKGQEREACVDLQADDTEKDAQDAEESDVRD